MAKQKNDHPFKEQAEKIAVELKDRLEDNTPQGRERKLAALSYAFIFCFIPLFANKKSAFVQFHARQGFVLFLLDVIVGLVVWMPFFGQLFFLILIIASVVGFIRALNGIWWEIPFVHEWSKKIHI
jgi:uncharacterized membrane protein